MFTRPRTPSPRGTTVVSGLGTIGRRMQRDSHGGSGGSVFVGRERELDALMRGLDDARAARGRLIALVGEAGIGKTRTIEEFLVRADLPDESVLWGRCPEHHGLPAYWPWTPAIGRYVEHHDAVTLPRVLGRTAIDLAPLVPEIGECLGPLEAPPATDPMQSRLRFFESLAILLRRAAERGPIVVLLDDLHW